MTDQNIAVLFAKVRRFGWHEEKHERNWLVHKIDFEDARGILDGDTLIIRSDRHGEVRYQIFGYVDDREVAAACTLRDDQCWLISVRSARRDERRKYFAGFSRRPTPGQD